MAPHFFFHGEGISSINDSQSGPKFRRAVRDILGFTFAEQAIDDLKNIRTQYTKRIAELMGEKDDLAIVAQDLASAEESLIKMQEKLEALRLSIETLENEQETLERKLADSKEDEVRRLRAEIQRCERKRTELQDQLKDVSVQRLALIPRFGWAVFAQKLAKQALDFIDESTLKGRIPSPYQETFVRDLLESGECICGSSLETGSAQQLRVSALIETAGSAAASQRLMKARSSADNIKGMSSEFLALNENLEARKLGLDAEVGKNEQEESALQGRLDSIDIGEVQNLNSDLKRVKQLLSQHNQEKGKTSLTIDNLKSEIERYRRELAKEIGSQPILKKGSSGSRVGDFGSFHS